MCKTSTLVLDQSTPTADTLSLNGTITSRQGRNKKMKKITEEALKDLAETEMRFNDFMKDYKTNDGMTFYQAVGPEQDQVLANGIKDYMDKCHNKDVNPVAAIFHVIDRMRNLLGSMVNNKNAAVLFEALAKVEREAWIESGCEHLRFRSEIKDGQKVLRVIINAEHLADDDLAGLIDSKNIAESHIFIFDDTEGTDSIIERAAKQSGLIGAPIIFHVREGCSVPAEILELAGEKCKVEMFATHEEGHALRRAIFPKIEEALEDHKEPVH